MLITTEIKYDGVVYSTAKAACQAAGINYNTLMSRASKKKLPVQEVFDWMVRRKQSGKARTVPPSKPLDIELPDGYESLYEACRVMNLDYHLVYNRIKKGMSFKDAVRDIALARRKKSRLSASNLGSPITLDGVVCESIAEVAAALGISGTALSYHLKMNSCSIQDAVAHYQQYGARLTRRSSSDIAASHIAYTGTDGKRYFYAVCKQCSAIVLVTEDVARSFEHGAMCSKFFVPTPLVVPRILAKLRKQCSKQIGGEHSHATDGSE